MLAGRKGKLRMKIDVIIPVYKPEKRFLELISRLEKQTLKPNRIIIMNTEEKYFEALLYGTDFAREHPNARCTIFPSGNSIMVEPEMMEQPAAQGIFSYA